MSSVKNKSESIDNYLSVLFPYTGNDDGIIDTTSLFTKRDLEQTADISAATRVTVENDRTIEITEDGVYVISGTASNCTIKVIADDSAKVQLVLDVLTVTNDDFPVIYVLSADEVLVTTTEGTSNCMTVTGAFKADGDSNTDAVIFSKEDIVFNGRMRKGARRKTARAIDNLCFCPPEKFRPPASTTASKSPSFSLTKSLACAISKACQSS